MNTARLRIEMVGPDFVRTPRWRGPLALALLILALLYVAWVLS